MRTATICASQQRSVGMVHCGDITLSRQICRLQCRHSPDMQVLQATRGVHVVVRSFAHVDQNMSLEDGAMVRFVCR